MDDEYLEMLGRVLRDARSRFVAEDKVLRDSDIPLKELDIHGWAQSYGSTAGPWGGAGGQMISSFPTQVVLCPCWSRHAMVYLAGRFAYAVDARSDWFQRAFDARLFPARLPAPAQSGGGAP